MCVYQEAIRCLSQNASCGHRFCIGQRTGARGEASVPFAMCSRVFIVEPVLRTQGFVVCLSTGVRGKGQYTVACTFVFVQSGFAGH